MQTDWPEARKRLEGARALADSEAWDAWIGAHPIWNETVPSPKWVMAIHEAFLAGRLSRADRIDALEAENARLREPFRYIDAHDWAYLERLLATAKRHPEDYETGIWIEVLAEFRAALSGNGFRVAEPRR